MFKFGFVVYAVLRVLWHPEILVFCSYMKWVLNEGVIVFRRVTEWLCANNGVLFEMRGVAKYGYRE